MGYQTSNLLLREMKGMRAKMCISVMVTQDSVVQ